MLDDKIDFIFIERANAQNAADPVYLDGISSGFGKSTGLGHKHKSHHFRPRASAILAGLWVVWGRRAAGKKTMHQPLARARLSTIVIDRNQR